MSQFTSRRAVRLGNETTVSPHAAASARHGVRAGAIAAAAVGLSLMGVGGAYAVGSVSNDAGPKVAGLSAGAQAPATVAVIATGQVVATDKLDATVDALVAESERIAQAKARAAQREAQQAAAEAARVAAARYKAAQAGADGALDGKDCSGSHHGSSKKNS